MTTGCSSLGYLVQAGRGQMELFNRARPVDQVIQDPKTPPRIKRLLSEIPSVLAFGQSQGLKPTPSYKEYVALNRPAVVWVVSASEELSFTPKKWSFPIVGSFNYLGWFNKDSALKHAQELRAEGWDADVRGASAYSTLGWFRDPILSTMIPEGEEAMGELVNTILHESVHATVFVKGQSYFNESLASFVADILTREYFKLYPTRVSATEWEAYSQAEKRGEARGEKYRVTYAQLLALYGSSESVEEKRARKKQLLTKLKEETGMQKDPNNATLIQFRTYGVGREEFPRFFENCGKNWTRFFQFMKELKPEDFSQEHAEEWKSLVGRKCS